MNSPTRIVRVLAALLAATLLRPLFAQDIAPAQLMGPRIVLDHDQVDLGILERGVIKDIPFIITNKGDQPLKIYNIELSCGCLTQTLSNAVVAPESKSLLVAKLASSILIGKFHKELYIKSNDPSAPRKTIVISGFSRSSVHTEPGVFSFGSVQRGKAVTKSIKVYDMADFGMRIRTIEKSSPQMQVVHTPLDPAKQEGFFKGKKGFLITVTLPPKYPLGELDESILIRTNLDVQPNIRIAVLGEITGDVTWLPNKLSLALVKQQTGRKRRIVIRSTSGQFRIQRIEHDEPFVDIVTYEKATGNYVVIVKVLPDSPRGPFNDEVKVFEEGTKKPVIRIPIYGLVKGTSAGHRPASKPKPSIPIKLKKGQSVEDME